MGRIPIDALRELAEDLKRGLNLPHLYLAGSQSPKHPGTVEDGSDIDFVCFPIDYKRRSRHYWRVNGRFRVKSKHPELDGKFVDIAVFDPKDPMRFQKMIKGHSVEYWRRFNVRLA